MPSTTRFYLSSDTIIDRYDSVLVSWSIPMLEAGEIQIGRTTVTVPLMTPTGRHYLIGVADVTDVVAESDETNNGRILAVTIE